MRALLLILIVAVVAAILAVGSGFLHLNQTQAARVPSLSVARNGVTAKGGQPPAFEVETGSVSVGTQRKDVQVAVPALRVNRPADAKPGNGAQ